MTWSFGKLGFAHPEMCAAAPCSRIRQDVRTLTRRATETARCRFRAFADALVDRDLSDFSGQAISITLWGFAAVRFDAPALFAKAARSVLSRGLDRFIPQEVGNILWAFATARQRQPLSRVTPRLTHAHADRQRRALRAGVSPPLQHWSLTR